MTDRTDITEYSDSELSLLVFNTEYLYEQRHSKGFDEVLDQLFIYTPKQWQELIADLQDDLFELNASPLYKQTE